MTKRATYVNECNGCGEREEVTREYRRGERRPAQVLFRGWIERQGRDYCPACAEGVLATERGG